MQKVLHLYIQHKLLPLILLKKTCATNGIRIAYIKEQKGRVNETTNQKNVEHVGGG